MLDHFDEFLEIKPYSKSNGLYIKWLSGNQSMSILDFSRAIEAFLNIFITTKPSKVLIDASSYNFPILPEKTTHLICYTLSDGSLKQYGLIKSNHQYGQIAIDLFLKQLAAVQVNMRLSDKQVEGLRWFLSR